MKKCNTCNKEYDDSKAFCPVCGGQLTTVTTTPSGSNAAPSWFENWAGIVFTLAGLIIAWELNVIIGVALGVVGIICGWSSPNQINKVMSVIVGAITIVLFIWYLFA